MENGSVEITRKVMLSLKQLLDAGQNIQLTYSIQSFGITTITPIYFNTKKLVVHPSQGIEFGFGEHEVNFADALVKNSSIHYEDVIPYLDDKRWTFIVNEKEYNYEEIIEMV